MNRKWVTAGVAGSYLLLFLTLLMVNPELFVYPLLEKPFVPLGNALFWVALIAFPIFLEAASSGFGKAYPWWYGKVRIGFKAALALAVLWWPVSYGLSGNFANNFSPSDTFVGGEVASRIFWGYSYAVVLVPLTLWLVRMVLSLLGSFRKQA